MTTHDCIYKGSGELYVFGNNDCGQLGLGHCTYRENVRLLLTNKDIKVFRVVVVLRSFTIILVNYIHLVTMFSDNWV
jgi:alpha-tubulin suppressor-like RCC1 family protein